MKRINVTLHDDTLHVLTLMLRRPHPRIAATALRELRSTALPITAFVVAESIPLFDASRVIRLVSTPATTEVPCAILLVFLPTSSDDRRNDVALRVRKERPRYRIVDAWYVVPLDPQNCFTHCSGATIIGSPEAT